MLNVNTNESTDTKRKIKKIRLNPVKAKFVHGQDTIETSLGSILNDEVREQLISLSSSSSIDQIKKGNTASFNSESEESKMHEETANNNKKDESVSLDPITEELIDKLLPIAKKSIEAVNASLIAKAKFTLRTIFL